MTRALSRRFSGRRRAGRRAGTARVRERGIALVIVMIVITVLSVLAGAFAFNMKVEARLAANANQESEMEWLGRSGVEFARYVISQSHRAGQPYSALNQFWAGGPGAGLETNGPLAFLSLKNNQLGAGTFSLSIVDLERRLNVNMADQETLNRAMALVGMDVSAASIVADSILDWRDADNDPHLSGTESDYYLSLTPAYAAKNGPIDDLSELLLIRGVTPDLFWGPAGPHHQEQRVTPLADSGVIGFNRPTYAVGLVDLFAAVSNGRVNLNTASMTTLQLIPGVDENLALSILRTRAGFDGTDGTEDDTPFMNPGLLQAVPGMNPQVLAQGQRFFGVVSTTFEVTVDVQLGQYRKQYVAILRRGSNLNEIEVLQFSWR